MKKALLFLAALFAFQLNLISCNSAMSPVTPLIPIDTTKPLLKILKITPLHGSIGIEFNASINIQFNLPLSASSINSSTIDLKDSTGKSIRLSLTSTGLGESVVATLLDSLKSNTAYTVTIHGGDKGILDSAKKGMALTVTSTFKTRGVLNRTGLVLLKWSDIASKFKGTFSLPPSNGGDVGVANNFVFSSGIHAQISNGNLLVIGHSYINKEAEIQIPEVLDGRIAPIAGSWFDVTGGLRPTGWGTRAGDPRDSTNSYVLGGMLDVGGRIIFAANQWYNGSGVDWGSIGNFEAGAAKGIWQVAGDWVHNQRIGGYLTYAPKGMSTLGYSFLAGLQGSSGAANGRWGPNLFAIQGAFPAKITDPLKSIALLAHPDEAKQPSGWWIGDKVSSIVWIETKTHQAVLVFLYQQVGGITWYGESSENSGHPPSPYPGYKGYHAAGYELQVWVYDPDLLYEVYNGTRKPWLVLPSEKAVLISRPPRSATETVNSFMTGIAKQELQVSYRNGRLVILQPDAIKYGDFDRVPKGYVLQLE